MTGAVVVRALTAADLDALPRLWSDAGLPNEPDGRDAPDALRRQRAADPELWLGAFVDDELVGCVLGSDDGRKGWVNRLAVHPTWTRRGVAAALLAVCEAVLVSRGRRVITSLVEQGNSASLAFFEAQGYAPRRDIVYLRKGIAVGDEPEPTGC